MNALLSPAQTVLTMSSHEIAELLQARHDSVKRSIERCVNRGAITPPPLVEVSNAGPGPLTMEVYLLGKRDSLVVVAQLSPEFTAAVVDRWQELEARQAPAIPQTMAQALRLAAEQAEALEHQQAQLEAAKPKVEFVDKYVNADSGAMNLRDVCKMLGAKQNEFTAWLLDRGIMYRTVPQAPLTPAANHMHAGRFIAKAGVAEHTEKSHAYVHYRFSAKGVTWIAAEWAKHRVVLAVAAKAVVA